MSDDVLFDAAPPLPPPSAARAQLAERKDQGRVVKTNGTKLAELFNEGELRKTSIETYLSRNVDKAKLPGNRPPQHITARLAPDHGGLKINVFRDKAGDLFVFGEFWPRRKLYPGE